MFYLRVWLFLAVLFSAAAADAALTHTLRCGSRLVGKGDAIEDVYLLCGEPTEQWASTEFVTHRLACGIDVTRAVPIESWTYNFGPKRFVRYLTFRDGRLVDIEQGGYGY